MHDTNIISSYRPDWSHQNSYNNQSIGLIPDDDGGYALQIKADRTRSHPQKFCIIYDPISEIELPGVYSYAEAKCILYATRGFNLYPEPFRKLLLAISDRSLAEALEILEKELGLSGEKALAFLRKLQGFQTQGKNR